MRVLMMTQALDPRDPLLAFTAGWVNALAGRLTHLHVLCLRAADLPLAPNVSVHVVGTRGDAGQVRRLLRFERLVRTLVPQVDVVFGHMIPRYVCLAAPAARTRRRPIVFWYTHRQTSPELRAALAAAAVVVTAVPASFPLTTSKLRPIGHGIDATWWSPASFGQVGGAPLAVHLARLAPIKHQDTALRALSMVASSWPNLRVAFVGGCDDTGYRARLTRLAAELGLEERVVFTGPLPPDEVREWVRRATVAINLSPAGLFDKAALETAIAGVPTIVADASFDSLLGDAAAVLRTAAPEDGPALAAALTRVLRLPAPARAELASAVRVRAIAAHDLPAFADRLVAVMRDAADVARGGQAEGRASSR